MTPVADFFRRIIPIPGRRRFDGASATRWSLDGARFGNLNAEISAAAQPLRERSRHAVNNNSHAAAGVAAWDSSLVGAGITATAQHPDTAVRQALQAAWNRWRAGADADGRTDFDGVVASAVRSMVVDGEAFLLMTAGERGLQLRQIPAEMVDAAYSVELGGGARIYAGIEFDASSRRVAYWVRPLDSSAVFETYAPPVRVAAEDVIHLFRPLGPGQVRGAPWLAPCLVALRELDQLLDALLVGAKVAAMHAGFLTDQNGTSTSNLFEGVQVGSILESGLEPGTLKVLPAGYDIRFSTPAQAQQTVEFAKMQLRSVASGLGVPEHLMTGDLSGANYSSLRAGLVDFRRRIEVIQFHVLVPQMLRPIWERFVTLAALSGSLDAPSFEATSEDYFACEWIPPAQDWVDPAKDADATATMIASGLMSRRQAVAAQGYSIEDLDAEIAADHAREAALGLSFAAPPTKELASVSQPV